MPTPRSLDSEGIRRSRRTLKDGRVVWLYRVEDLLGKETSQQFDSEKEGMVWANRTRADFIRGASAGKASLLVCGLEVASLLDGECSADYVQTIKLVAQACARDGLDDLKDQQFAVEFKKWLNAAKPGWHLGPWSKNMKFQHKAATELSKATKLKLSQAMRRIVNHAMSKPALGLMRDPLIGFKPPRPPGGIKPTFTVDEMKILVGDGFRHHPWWLAMCLLFYTGCRAQEAMHLRWEWIDFIANVIRVQPHADYDVKFDKPREFPLQPELREILLQTLQSRPWARRGGRAEGWIIENDDMRARGVCKRARRVTRRLKNAYTRAFKMALVDAKIPLRPRLSTHSTRHTFITVQLAGGISSTNLMDWVGHEEETTTVGYGKGRMRYMDQVDGWPASVRRGLTMCLRHDPASAFHNPDEFTEDSPVIVVGVPA